MNNISGNLFENIENLSHDAEFFQDLVKIKDMRIERIVSRGQSSPEQGTYYNQDWYEFVLVIDGWAVIEMENNIYRLDKGSWLSIAPHAKHRVLETSTEPPCVWLAIHQKNILNPCETSKSGEI